MSLVGRRHLADQIYQQIRARILEGRLRPAEALPSSRELAQRLAVSRNTVTAAFDRLTADGLVSSRAGVGAFVRDRDLEARSARRSGSAELIKPQPLWAEIGKVEDFTPTESEFDFRTGLPSSTHFPYATWRTLLARQLRQNVGSVNRYGDPSGDTWLRDAIARHVNLSRGVAAASENVFITGGIQQALDLISRVLLAPGDVVAVEDPGYLPAGMLFQSHRCQVVGVPIDDEGLMVSAIPDDARLIYVTPSHQFPLGMSMSTNRRRELLEHAERTGAVIVEDDYDSEFRYAGRPMETLQSIDDEGRVLYVGSFSKVLLPSLRLGFLVAPSSLFSALRKARLVSDWHTPTPLQGALAEFIDNGQLAKHIRRMRRIYERRHLLIESTLESDFDAWLQLIPSMAGLHITALMKPACTVNDTTIMARARQHGLESYAHQAVSRVARSVPPRPAIMLGYGNMPEELIPEGLHRLRECFAS